jgi:DNA-binding FadR family transcriptional regulator
MAEATGVGRRKVLDALRIMQKEGRLQVRQAQRVGINGRPQPVPVYTILPKKKK